MACMFMILKVTIETNLNLAGNKGGKYKSINSAAELTSSSFSEWPLIISSEKQCF